MSNLELINKELSGRTGMEADAEQDLFHRIAQIESSEFNIQPLLKADWIGVACAILLLGVAPVMYYAMKLL